MLSLFSNVFITFVKKQTCFPLSIFPVISPAAILCIELFLLLAQGCTLTRNSMREEKVNIVTQQIVLVTSAQTVTIYTFYAFLACHEVKVNKLIFII